MHGGQGVGECPFLKSHTLPGILDYPMVENRLLLPIPECE